MDKFERKMLVWEYNGYLNEHLGMTQVNNENESEHGQSQDLDNIDPRLTQKAKPVPRYIGWLELKLEEKLEDVTRQKRQIEDLSSRLETCTKQRDDLITKCKAHNIKTGINLDLNAHSSDESEPRPPPYESSDEEKPEQFQKMEAKKLDAMLKKVRKGRPQTEEEVIIQQLRYRNKVQR